MSPYRMPPATKGRNRPSFSVGSSISALFMMMAPEMNAMASARTSSGSATRRPRPQPATAIPARMYRPSRS